MKATVKIFDRPYLENPVYRVEVAEASHYIQREHNGDVDLWYEVVKLKGCWTHKGNFIGFTKQEAINHLDFITQ